MRLHWGPHSATSVVPLLLHPQSQPPTHIWIFLQKWPLVCEERERFQRNSLRSANQRAIMIKAYCYKQAHSSNPPTEPASNSNQRLNSSTLDPKAKLT